MRFVPPNQTVYIFVSGNNLMKRRFCQRQIPARHMRLHVAPALMFNYNVLDILHFEKYMSKSIWLNLQVYHALVGSRIS